MIVAHWERGAELNDDHLKRSLRAVLLREPVLFWRQQRQCLWIIVLCLHLPNSFAGKL
jgi:hypothetical protein